MTTSNSSARALGACANGPSPNVTNALTAPVIPMVRRRRCTIALREVGLRFLECRSAMAQTLPRRQRWAYLSSSKVNLGFCQGWLSAEPVEVRCHARRSGMSDNFPGLTGDFSGGQLGQDDWHGSVGAVLRKPVVAPRRPGRITNTAPSRWCPAAATTSAGSVWSRPARGNAMAASTPDAVHVVEGALPGQLDHRR